MRSLKSYLLIALLFGFFSCKDNPEDTPPKLSASEVQKEAIVSVLNNRSELSEFAAALKSMDFADVEAENFTVFAVKNTGMDNAISKAASNSVKMKRHIIKGRRTKTSLRDQQELTAFDGSVLIVEVLTEGGRVVYVNGEELGDEITAGKSTVFIVENAIQETISDMPVTSIRLNSEAASLLPGETYHLTATVLPGIAANKKILWSSSDDKVASVSDEGVVTAIASGTTTITVKTEDGQKTATCVVTVIKQYLMTMTATAAKVTLKIAGVGKMTIDWGDGSVETHTFPTINMSNYSDAGWYSKPAYAHNYSGASSHTITILGEKVIDLSCGADPIGCVSFNNQVTSVDVSDNTALLYLDCCFNQLTKLDVSKNTVLKGLYCFDNQITSLDVSKNTVLEQIQCYNNQISSIDVGKNTVLQWLDCQNNKISSLDVGNNPALTRLCCSMNPLMSLNVTKNPALTILRCNSNQLTVLDLSKNTLLKDLECNTNSLTSLDVSKNTLLKDLGCASNSLTSLGVSNNTALTFLSCSNNQITNFDVSNNTALIYFYCSNNQLKSLDVSNNIRLTLLTCGNNQLKDLDISNSTSLRNLECGTNQLTSLDISKNLALAYLFVENNQLTTLDVSKHTALESFKCENNRLTSLDVGKSTKLVYLFCANNQLTTEGLNYIFGTLHNNTITYPEKTVFIRGNPGTYTCDRSIALDKGWAVNY